jgi:hypothetical protein
MKFIRRFYARIEANESDKSPPFTTFLLACLVGQLELLFDSGKFSEEYLLERKNLRPDYDDD